MKRLTYEMSACLETRAEDSNLYGAVARILVVAKRELDEDTDKNTVIEAIETILETLENRKYRTTNNIRTS